MKKIYQGAFILLLLASCSNEEKFLPEDVSQKAESQISNRSIEEAISIAQQVVDSKKIYSKDGLTVNKDDVKVIYSKNNSRSENTDTLMYAVNNEDGNGFILVAAPRCVAPIIAIVDEGEFGSSETEDNSNFQYALAASEAYVNNQVLQNTGISSTVEIIPFNHTDTLNYNKEAEHRLNTRWNQYWPENIYTPNGIAGCVPVAIAQMCNYFAYPSSVNLEYSGADIDVQSLEWTSIGKHVNSLGYNYDATTVTNHLNSCECGSDYHLALARFIRQIGETANASYLRDRTSVSEDYAISAVKYYLTGKTFTSFSSADDLYNKISSEEGLALMMGTGTSGGHAWVSDGHMEISYILSTVEGSTLNGKPVTLTKTKKVDEKYLHYNWGWGGNSNGYFLTDIFDPSKGYLYDSGSSLNSSVDYGASVNIIYVQ